MPNDIRNPILLCRCSIWRVKAKVSASRCLPFLEFWGMVPLPHAQFSRKTSFKHVESCPGASASNGTCGKIEGTWREHERLGWEADNKEEIKMWLQEIQIQSLCKHQQSMKLKCDGQSIRRSTHRTNVPRAKANTKTTSVDLTEVADQFIHRWHFVEALLNWTLTRHSYERLKRLALVDHSTTSITRTVTSN